MANRRIDFARRMAAHDPASRLYAILDAENCAVCGLDLFAVAKAWRDAGIALVQYRDKVGSPEDILQNARRLRDTLPNALLLLNDHAELVPASGLDGVHVGQNDMSVAQVRAMLGDDAIIGVSTHTADQALAAQATDCDYIAIGPVYPTRTKQDAEPAVGLCGVQAARAVTRKPLVAIGGIRLQRAKEIQAAGADGVALISSLLQGDLRATAEEWRMRLG